MKCLAIVFSIKFIHQTCRLHPFINASSVEPNANIKLNKRYPRFLSTPAFQNCCSDPLVYYTEIQIFILRCQMTFNAKDVTNCQEYRFRYLLYKGRQPQLYLSFKTNCCDEKSAVYTLKVNHSFLYSPCRN